MCVLQVEQRLQEKWEEQHRVEQEEEEEREALRIKEEELRLEMESMAKKGYQEKVKDKNQVACYVNEFSEETGY